MSLRTSKLVGIFGSSNPAPPNVTLAYCLGEGLARRKISVITGGSKGISEEAAKGALSEGGKVICFLPEYEKSKKAKTISVPKGAHPFFLLEGSFKTRNMLSIANCRVAIFIEGKWGTLNELALAVDFGIPSVVFSGTGGVCSVVEDICKAVGGKNNIYFVETLEEALKIISEVLDRI